MAHFRGRTVALLGVIAIAAGFSLTGTLGALGSAAPVATGVTPNQVNELDCNGLSTVYKSIKPDFGGLCTDPLTPPGTYSSKANRFYDNGRYIGHDEPSVKFISTAAGTGDNMTYLMRLAIDPSQRPTDNAGPNNVTDYAELSPAPWFGLPICDPLSYPQNPCTPQSDSNSGGISDPNAAGSAFLELQFYPPGFVPFADGPSCDATHYCAALTIDSLEATYGFAAINPACEEPVNFAYLQRNGEPTGPPSPQLSTPASEVPNQQTLLMNQGDVLAVSIRDIHVRKYTETIQGKTYTVPAGLALDTSIDDLTTHQSGYMIASAANGFMDTEGIVDGQVNQACPGQPFNFTAEYSSASQQNQVPWAAAEGGVLMEDELGHFEVCQSVSSQLPVVAGDSHVYQVCNHGSEGSASTGPEQGCSLTTGACPGATTEDGLACPAPAGQSEPNFTEGLNCEYSDALCLPAGPRHISNDGATTVADWPVAGCQADYFQNGDLDFDGTSYQPDWPDGSSAHPTSFEYIGPFSNGRTYPDVQIETDLPASEGFCNVTTGLGCSVPPVGAAFYPFWSLGRSQVNHGPALSSAMVPAGQGPQRSFPACVWDFGNDIPGTTINNLGGDAEYGVPDVLRYGGTAISPVEPNPELNCRA